MKRLALIVSILLTMSLPTLAAEYQGKTIDGRKIPAKVYSYETGGVFEAQVEFNGNFATIHFVNGGQLRVRLNQSQIKDPNNILGHGRVGQVALGRFLSIGLAGDNPSTGGIRISAGSGRDLWMIRLTERL
jgi:hypothetical protein